MATSSYDNRFERQNGIDGVRLGAATHTPDLQALEIWVPDIWGTEASAVTNQIWSNPAQTNPIWAKLT